MKLARTAVIALCISAMLSGASGTLAAQEPALPKGLPAYGPIVAFHSPRVLVRKLANGMTLWLAPRPGFPKVALAVVVRGGYAADPVGAPGISDLLLDAIDQGTRTHTALEIADEFEAAGGALEGQPLSDADLLTVSVLASKLDPAMQALADVMRNATFPASQVALAQRDEEEALKARDADAQFAASRAIARALFGANPYSTVAPTQLALAGATPAELRAIYAREFRPDQTLLVAVGDFTVKGFTQSAGRLFGGWSTPREPPVAAAKPPDEENPHDVFVVPRPGSVQTDLILGAFAPVEGQPDFPAVEVANAIYGAMYGSLLFTVVREQKGYSYSPRSVVRSRRAAGTIETIVNARNPVTGACLSEVLTLLKRMATVKPDAQQVLRAKRYLMGTASIRYQLEANLAKRLATLWMEGLTPEQFEQESAGIESVTPDQAMTAGLRYFAPGRTSIVAVGDATSIRSQLTALRIPLRSLP
ncbi:MAG: M16 family metallopeptidase [Terriglobia bacterium]